MSDGNDGNDKLVVHEEHQNMSVFSVYREAWMMEALSKGISCVWECGSGGLVVVKSEVDCEGVQKGTFRLPWWFRIRLLGGVFEP